MTRLIDVDAETLAIAWAIADTDIQAMFGSDPVRVSGGLDPTQAAVLPAARIQRIATTEPVFEHLTAPVLEVNVWATNPPMAFDGAQLLRARLHDRAIVGVHAGLGVVTGLDTAQGLRQLAIPDLPLLARYTFAVRYFVHPLPT